MFAFNVTRFAVVGFSGFVANYFMLLLFFDILSLPILLSQLIGAELALLTTFAGNNFWAFRDHHHIPIRIKLMKYHVTSGSGILITSSMVVLLVHFAHFYYVVALVFAACVGMVWNFLFNSKVIFKKQKKDLANFAE